MIGTPLDNTSLKMTKAGGRGLIDEKRKEFTYPTIKYLRGQIVVAMHSFTSEWNCSNNVIVSSFSLFVSFKSTGISERVSRKGLRLPYGVEAGTDTTDGLTGRSPTADGNPVDKRRPFTRDPKDKGFTDGALVCVPGLC